MTDLLASHMGELASVRWLVRWIPLERLPALEGSGGSDYFRGELDFPVERGRGVDCEELGSVLDERRSAEVGIDLGAEACRVNNELRQH